MTLGVGSANLTKFKVPVTVKLLQVWPIIFHSSQLFKVQTDFSKLGLCWEPMGAAGPCRDKVWPMSLGWKESWQRRARSHCVRAGPGCSCTDGQPGQCTPCLVWQNSLQQHGDGVKERSSSHWDTRRRSADRTFNPQHGIVITFQPKRHSCGRQPCCSSLRALWTSMAEQSNRAKVVLYSVESSEPGAFPGQCHFLYLISHLKIPTHTQLPCQGIEENILHHHRMKS